MNISAVFPSSLLAILLTFAFAAGASPARGQSPEGVDLRLRDPGALDGSLEDDPDPGLTLTLDPENRPASLRDGRRMLYAGVVMMSSAVLYSAISELTHSWECDDVEQRNTLHPVGFGVVVSVGGAFSFVGGGRLAGARLHGRGGRLDRRDRWRLAMEMLGVGFGSVGFMSLLSHAGASQCRADPEPN